MIKVLIRFVSNEEIKEIINFDSLEIAIEYCFIKAELNNPELFEKGWGTDVVISKPKKYDNYKVIIDRDSDIDYELLIEDDWRY